MFPLLAYYTDGNFTVIKSGDSSVHSGGIVENGIVTVTANYSILENDYIINCDNAAIINLTLPNSTTIGRVFRIFVKNRRVNILTSGSQVINEGITSLSLRNYEMVTLRLVENNLWRIGD